MLRRFPALLLIVALALRGLVPAGYMLAPTPDGSFAVVVCTSQGPLTVAVDGNGQPVEPHQDSTGSLCVFAASAPAVAALCLPELPAPSFDVAVQPRMPRAEAMVTRAIRSLPPARGPPVTV